MAPSKENSIRQRSEQGGSSDHADELREAASPVMGRKAKLRQGREETGEMGGVVHRIP